MSIIDSISNVNDYINMAGVDGYIRRMQNKSSSIQQYNEVLRRRQARNQFTQSDYPWKPSSIMADLRDSNNVNGLGSSLTQLKHEIYKTSPSSSTRIFGDESQRYFESYYDYLNRQNQMHNLNYNQTEQAQLLHQYQNTSNSNYIQFKNRQINKGR